MSSRFSYNLGMLCRILTLIVFLISLSCSAQTQTASGKPVAPSAPVATATSPSTLFNGWKLSPAGKHLKIQAMPLKIVLSPDGNTLAAVCAGAHPGLAIVDIKKKEFTSFSPLPASFNGIAFSNDAKRLFVAGGNSDQLHVFDFNNGNVWAPKTIDLTDHPQTKRSNRTGPADFLASITVHPTTGTLYICNEAQGEIWVVNPDTLKLQATWKIGDHPHTCVFGRDARYLYVSNWGDRSVAAIDINTGSVKAKIPVGIRPNDMALAPDGRLFVACAGDNTVHVIQTGKAPEAEKVTTENRPPSNNALEIISTSLYPSSPEGSTPDAVAVSPDGKALFIANADNNNVCVVDISDPKVSKVVGFVPTGWYPTAVATNGKTLFVADGKGLSSHPNYPLEGENTRVVLGVRFEAATPGLRGFISFIDPPTPAELVDYTKQVRANCPFMPSELRRANIPADSIIPRGSSDDCPIKHVLYIIKENRTYDQVFGDMPKGNGDKNICMFGDAITPNHHQLARDYVLLDNFYCSGEVSVDGHSWCDAAIATDYNERAWITSYSGHGRLPGNADMARPTAGYLWDLCKRSGVSFKCYGEGAPKVPTANRGTWPGGRDPAKVDGWIKDLHEAETTGDLPGFMIMSLGEDHTHGTRPGDNTPQACVASNDVAIGKIVAAASRSKFWNEIAIFIVEDDAQNGPDHVDSHRTVALVISPYCKRGVVDSTPYTNTSMVRTIELILGLPPMTQYDAAATPMFNCFQKTSKSIVYNPRTPQTDLAAVNKKNAHGAKASSEMDFDDYDEAPEDELNRILWAAVKGEDLPYPTPIHGVLFTR